MRHLHIKCRSRIDFQPRCFRLFLFLGNGSSSVSFSVTMFSTGDLPVRLA